MLILNPKAWNWKAAVLSSAYRGALFFTVNLGAGMHAALGARSTEFAYRGRRLFHGPLHAVQPARDASRGVGGAHAVFEAGKTASDTAVALHFAAGSDPVRCAGLNRFGILQEAVVAASSGGPRFLVENGRTGFVATTVREFAAAVARLYLDQPLRLAMRALARKAAERYSWNCVIAEVYENYDTCFPSFASHPHWEQGKPAAVLHPRTIMPR